MFHGTSAQPNLNSPGTEVLTRLRLLIGEEDVDGDLAVRERMGTHHFMALTPLLLPPWHAKDFVHTTSHDLESFYWVLAWAILRHTNHAHPSGDDAFLAVFPDTDEPYEAFSAKLLWLKFGVKQLAIPNNQPLTDLVLKLSAVVCKHYAEDTLEYDMVLQYFADALAPDQKWPKDDKALARRSLPAFRSTSPAVSTISMTGSMARSPSHGRGLKRKLSDEPLPPRDDIEGPVYYDDDADPVAVPNDDTLPAARAVLLASTRQANQGQVADVCVAQAAPAHPSKRPVLLCA
ncbi:hypothetical protein GSI_09767 [Ganoderma sinense ZZ0214-1]|uniref:Fungal-type protein kinase domain-containing protein n=1 Tax=Ganoderma sinense ZZ0214-1 TaxID=1077348 RepID=A0A2G8S2W8_9APHY|nr:hypothetical protein GSI_09767 [Ganoderma sinense ZZ0214-1]